MSVEYHPVVEAELKAIQRYYEDRSPGLGGRFVDEFERHESGSEQLIYTLSSIRNHQAFKINCSDPCSDPVLDRFYRVSLLP